MNGNDIWVREPETHGGFPVFARLVNSRQIHWVAQDEAKAAEYEKNFMNGSRLLQLVLLRAYTLEGLTDLERAEAHVGFETGLENLGSITEYNCIACGARPIGDTQLYREHGLFSMKRFDD